MKVFKFGGASVKDADAVKNVVQILQDYSNQNLFVVVSAMGKTTNALEALTQALYKNPNKTQALLLEIQSFHFSILHELFDSDKYKIFDDLHNSFVELEWILDHDPEQSYDHTYDQVVSFGEIFSTQIISAYLNYKGLPNRWIDVRDFLRTDESYREAVVDWEETTKLYQRYFQDYFSGQNTICVTQGFIGCTSENYTTTLGREGSDYTASIMAYLNHAEQLTIWKDVAGVMNADPKKFNDALLLKHLNYYDAVELTYYGATVLHPKTIKPIQNKNIPLYVRSFIHPHQPGTTIDNRPATQLVPCYIYKPSQILFSISSKDFSFIVEENISKILGLLALYRVKVNVMQNSALSFSLCVDNNEKSKELAKHLSESFYLRYNDDVELYTIRHYDAGAIHKITQNKHVLLEQRSRSTIQLVVKKVQ